jgi:hypothetical protein
MVVLSGRVSISGDPETVLCFMPGIGIGIGKGDDRLTAFKQLGRIRPNIQIPFKPGHVTVVSVCEPAQERIEMGRSVRPGKSDGNKARAFGKGDE